MYSSATVLGCWVGRRLYVHALYVYGDGSTLPTTTRGWQVPAPHTKYICYPLSILRYLLLLYSKTMADIVPTMAEQDAPANDKSQQDDQPTSDCTVFQNPKHYTIKHPLRHSWTLWYDIPVTKVNEKDWMAGLKQIYTFKYVEDFWAYVNSVCFSFTTVLLDVGRIWGGLFCVRSIYCRDLRGFFLVSEFAILNGGFLSSV